jgi:hypothetical protein
MPGKFLAFCSSVILLLACSVGGGNLNTVVGSGNSASVTRTVDPFTSIQVEGLPDVTVSFGKTQSVIVETDDNILPLVETLVQGRKLIIRLANATGISSRLGIHVTIVMPSLQAVIIPGLGRVTITDLVADQVDFKVEGSGSLAAQGTVQTIHASLDGSGKISCGDLQSQVADVSVTGSGNITVNVTDSLKVKVDGSGSVNYRGNPAQVAPSVSGKGKIAPVP